MGRWYRRKWYYADKTIKSPSENVAKTKGNTWIYGTQDEQKSPNPNSLWNVKSNER